MGRSAANPGVDRLSNLPDPVLSQIISHLPIEEAIRTTVLAKRWRPVWKYATCLDFNARTMLSSLTEIFGLYEELFLPSTDEDIGVKDSPIVTDFLRSTSLITPILQSHKANLTKCRIVHIACGNYVSQVNEWIEFLLNKKLVETLILACKRVGRLEVEDQGLDLTPGIFSVSTLQVLELKRYRFAGVSPFIGCDNLRTLKLNKVLLDDDTLTAIVSACRFLKELRMNRCEGYKVLAIHHNKLEFLELKRLVPYKINIRAESLNVLILDSIRYVQNYAFIYAPMVTEFHAYVTNTGKLTDSLVELERNFMSYLEPDNLLARCSGLLQPEDTSSIFTQSNYVSPFVNLQFLYTSLDLNNIRETIILAFLFGTCTQLQKLVLVIQSPGTDNEDDGDNGFPYPKNTYWDKKEIFDSISKSLKQVVLGSYKGRVLELGLVQYLITSAPKMEKITIGFNSKCTKEAAMASRRNILLLPRANSNLSIVFKSGRTGGGSFGDWINTRK